MSLYINGEWRQGAGEPFSKTNPVGGEVLWQGRAATAAQVNDAVLAARRALPDWARRPMAARVARLERFASLVAENATPLARAISRETGKTVLGNPD